ncbi:hypothetical protein D9M70_557460 [compost metagenome]
MQFCHATEIVVVGVETFGRLAFGALHLDPFELRRNRADDAFGYLILQLENVVERAFEALGPEMRTGRGIDELAGDADLLSRFAHAPFQNIAHAELTPRFGRFHGAVLVGEARIARDDKEPAEP